MMWSNRKVLITGADGFIGSHLREASGWTPKVSLEEGLAKTVDWWSGELAGVRAPTDYVM